MNQTVIIGDELEVKRVGLGTNRIISDDKSKSALKSFVEFGGNFIDTAAAYTGGESEKTISKTIESNKGVIIATKGGMHVPDFHVDGRPELLTTQLAKSLEKLKTQTIDLYFLHRVDPGVPFEQQMNFLKQAQSDGKIKHIGLSHVTIEQIQQARKIFKVAAVENEYNMDNRENDEVIDFCEKEEIVFVPYFPMHGSSNALFDLTKKYNATEAQITLAWHLRRSPIMLPIPGSLTEEHIKQNLESLKIELTKEDFKRL